MKKIVLLVGLFSAVVASGCGKDTKYSCVSEEEKNDIVIRVDYQFTISNKKIKYATKQLDGANVTEFTEQELTEVSEAFTKAEGNNAKEKLTAMLKSKYNSSGSVLCNHL